MKSEWEWRDGNGWWMAAVPQAPVTLSSGDSMLSSLHYGHLHSSYAHNIPPHIHKIKNPI